MATSKVDYGDISRNGNDINNWFYGLPNIGAHSTLNSLILHFPYVYRQGGAANGGKITVEISGSTLTVSSISRNTEYKNLSLNITNYVSYNSSGGLYFKSGDHLNIKLYHNIVVIGSQSDWTVNDIYLEATYTQGSHSYTSSSSVIVNPTCTTAGTRRKYCSCGAYTDETIPALGHSYVDTVTPPTCTAQGYTTHTCSCGDSYVDTYVAALGHNYVATNVVQPSGTSPGYTQYTCSNGCGGSELRDYTNSISVKAGTGCSQITVDGVEPTTEGATRNFVFWQNSVFTLYSYPKTGYTFEKWIIRNADGSESTNTTQHLPVTLNSNISVEAVYKLATYTATFLNGDGSVLETVTVAHGDTPVCSKTPTKAIDEEYIYTWDASNPWTPAIGAISADQVYTPNFITTKLYVLDIEGIVAVGYGDHKFRSTATSLEKFDKYKYRLPVNSVATIEIFPEEGYRLKAWEDGSTDNPRNITITSDISISAEYEIKVPKFKSVTITRSSDLAQVTINTPVDAESKFIISVEVI